MPNNQPRQPDLHDCDACGAGLHPAEPACNAVCETCGHIIDIEGGAVPCLNCGAQLAFPVSINHLLCPYNLSEKY
jgi:predicted RNA-binding Zn-ribbon protein involved in translation (DUF1610 family)